MPFAARTSSTPRFSFDTMGGRYLVLCFYGSGTVSKNLAAFNYLAAKRDLFDDTNICLFGVSVDPDDERLGRMRNIIPGVRHFWDFDGAVSTLYGAMQPSNASVPGPMEYRPFTLIIDPMMRILALIPMSDTEAHNRECDRILSSLTPLADHAGVELTAPVLVVPRIFEPAFCRSLIELYDTHGGRESGFMKEKDGKTIFAYDHSFKRRKDYMLEDEQVIAAARVRLYRRLLPMIEKAFQYKITRIERYIVACYTEQDKGFFSAHRDNTTKGTAHRRFAVTLNLNAEEFEGGELRFPEFGPRTYRAPTGGAVVFSCSLLHEATPVTKGIRYAFLPFLYDEEAAKLREENLKFLSEDVERTLRPAS